MNKKFDVLLSCSRELRSLADDLIGQIVHVSSDKEIFAVFCFAKAHKTQGAVLLLCENGLGQDAAMLMRSLIDILITLFYILDDPGDERMQRYFDYDWILRKKMFVYCKSRPELLALMPHDDVKIVEEQAKIAQQKYGYERNWSNKNIREMAEEIGRVDLYATVYSLQSQIIHTASRAMNEYIKKDGEEYKINVGTSDSWIEETLVASFDCFYNIIFKCNELLQLGKTSQLERIMERYVKEVENCNSSPLL